jgi:hypothetical protein
MLKWMYVETFGDVNKIYLAQDRVVLSVSYIVGFGAFDL